jgi:hypothetical protein
MSTALAGFQAYAAGTLRALDLLGVFVFALSGAVAGVKKRLDLFGVLVLAFATGAGGTAVFLSDFQESVYRRLSCNRIKPQSPADRRSLGTE